MRPDGYVDRQQKQAEARLGQEEGTRCPCLRMWGTQEVDWLCPNQWNPKPPLYPSFPSSADAEAQASSAALLSQEAVLAAQMVTTLEGSDSILGQAREARRWTEQLLWGTSQPTGTALWKLKLKGLVDRVQMLHPQLLRLLVKTGVVGGHVDHCGWVAGIAKVRTLLGLSWVWAIGNLRCALGSPILFVGMQGSGLWASLRSSTLWCSILPWDPTYCPVGSGCLP